MAYSYPIAISYGAGRPPTTDIDKMIDAGAQGVRIALSWDSGDPTHSGVYSPLSSWTNLIQYAFDRDFKILLQVALGADFNGRGFSHNADGINVVEKLAAFAVSLGDFYADLLYAFELGNEMNHKKWSDPALDGGVTAHQKGGRYLEFLARTYVPLKAAQPGLTIITGGLGGIRNNPADVPADEFTQDMFDASVVVGGTTYNGPNGLFDAWNHHGYTYYETPTEDLNIFHDRGMTNYKRVRAILDAEGASSKKIWMTEFGSPVPFGGHSLADGAAILKDLFDTWETLDGGDGAPVYVFTWQDKAADTSVSENNFGLIDFAGNKKNPLYNTFEQAAKDVPVTPPPDTGGWGINISATTSGASTVAQRVKDLWDDAGSSEDPWVRVQPEWAAAQPGAFTGTAGQWDTFVWTQIDAILDAAFDKGLKICWVIGYLPNALQDGHGDKRFANRDAINGFRDVANYGYGLQAHCEGRHAGVSVAHELWNEITLPGPPGGFLLPVNVPKYASMLKTYYTCLKTGVLQGRTTRAAFADVKIGVAGISPEPPGTPGALDAVIKALADNGAANSFDWVGDHPYGLQCPPDKNVSWNQRLHVLPQARAVLNSIGRSDAEIWLTEDGCFNRRDSTPTDTGDTANCGTFGTNEPNESHEITETMTATRIAELAAWWSANKAALKLGRLFYWELEDQNANTDWTNHAGLYDFASGHNGAEKTGPHDAFLAAIGGDSDPVRTAPTVHISAPLDDPGHTNPLSGDVVVIIPATDTVDDPQDLDVKLYRANGSTLIGTASWSPLVGKYYIIEEGDLADGNYVLAAKATNSAPLTSAASDAPNGIRIAIDNASDPVDTTIEIASVISEGETFTPPFPAVRTDDELTLVLATTGPVSSVGVWEGTDDPYGPNLLGNATPGANGAYTFDVRPAQQADGYHRLVPVATAPDGTQVVPT